MQQNNDYFLIRLKGSLFFLQSATHPTLRAVSTWTSTLMPKGKNLHPSSFDLWDQQVITFHPWIPSPAQPPCSTYNMLDAD